MNDNIKLEIEKIPHRFFDMNEVCEYIHLSKSKVYKMVCNDEIPFIKLGFRTLFDVQQIDRWVVNGGRKEEDIPQLPTLNF